ncbi:hypothetical protein [Mucilaginibacter sp.]|uniref:hypothetical protein n=1 Tax=Mucilaginibacter sp. TaxID=1882438 RepID=UPI003D0DFC42
MEIIFNELIDTYLNGQVGVATNFLTKELAAHLTTNLQQLYSDDLLQLAGTGNELLINHDLLIRKDKIYWLDRIHHNKYEDAFFDLMDLFVI